MTICSKNVNFAHCLLNIQIMSMNQGEYISKPRYEILDGLRGVAALMVVIFHLSEAFSYDPVYKHLNHGYLCVDFFFVLSGFVIGYAYDKRMKDGTMSRWDFFKSRLIRLQPMVLFGVLLGAMLFYFQDSAYYYKIAETSVWTLLLYVLLEFLMIPKTPTYNIRGNDELYSLNIPQWSLLFEYFANLLYGLFVYKMGKKSLIFLVSIFTLMLVDSALTLNLFNTLLPHDYPCSLNAGWSLDPEQLYIGIARVGFSFFAGLLMFRLGKVINVKHAFWLCSLIIIGVVCVENVGGYEHPLWDGIFNLACTLILFPLTVAMGAGSKLQGKKSSAICLFLGKISYPLYLVHYPLVYLFFAWIDTHHDAPVSVLAFVSVSVVLLAILLAYAAMKLYDEPVRKWLRSTIHPFSKA